MVLPLDASQSQFVQSTSQNIRLLAPAGCGKTHSLLYRCLNLFAKEATSKPRFLVVTFTVAAKSEIQKRLISDSVFQPIRDHVTVTTLNSYGFTRIKSNFSSPKLLISKNDFHFAVVNQLRPIWIKYPLVEEVLQGRKKNWLAKEVMTLIDEFKSLGFDHTRHLNLEAFQAHFSELHSQGLHTKLTGLLESLNRLSIIEVAFEEDEESFAQKTTRTIYSSFFRFWREAVNHLHSSATFTLEDQKYFAFLDEQGKLEAKSYLSGAAGYDHVLIDEFQDINPLDLALVKSIADRNRASLTIVGDDDQAIFEWRGATPEYILNPDKYFGRSFSTEILETNYRSPRNVVLYSKNLISVNKRRVEKSIRPHRGDDAQITVKPISGINESLDFVEELILSNIENQESPAKLAVIGRKRNQIIPFQIFFASKGISFCAAEDLQVFMSKAFDRLLDVLIIRDIADQRQPSQTIASSTISLCNLVKRYPLSKADEEGLRRFLSQQKCPTLREAASALADYRGQLKGPNLEGAMSLQFSSALQLIYDTKTVDQTLGFLGMFFEGLQTDLGKAEEDIFFVDPPFAQLAEFAVRYGEDFTSFVDDVETAKNQLAYLSPYEDPTGEDASTDLLARPVHLMTALRAKGKEFDHVVLLDVNEGIWPSKHAKTVEQLEAERRVFYVAFTRAKKSLSMLVPEKFGSKPAVPSRFLDELFAGSSNTTK